MRADRCHRPRMYASLLRGTEASTAGKGSVMPEDRDVTGPRQSRIAHRTAQLSVWSRLLHRIDHVSSLPSVAVAVILLMLVWVVIGVAIGFPSRWIATFEVVASGLTLLMVFAIQHTQAREQAATQRKLDELIRALPGASEKLMMLEEAPTDVMQEVEEDHRDQRTESLAEHPHEDGSAPLRSTPGGGHDHT